MLDAVYCSAVRAALAKFSPSHGFPTLTEVLVELKGCSRKEDYARRGLGLFKKYLTQETEVSSPSALRMIKARWLLPDSRYLSLIFQALVDAASAWATSTDRLHAEESVKVFR